MSKRLKMRVEIPRNAKDLLLLAASILAKHTADGTASPLNLLEDITWVEEGPKVAAALAKHDEAENYRLLMEKAYRERDLIMKDTPTIVKNSRDLLTGIHRENMKRLGDWGFSVDHSPRAKKAIVHPITPINP